MATIDDFRALLDSMDPAERQAFIDSLVADYAGQETNLQSRSDYAEALRRAPGPGMRRAGRLSVAAHPLEHLARAGQAGLGEYEARRVRDERTAAGEQRQRTLANLMRGLTSSAPPRRAPVSYGVDPQEALARALRAGA